MFDKSKKSYLSSEPKPAAIVRWLPTIVVLGVMGGFVTLAWYAYHAGTQSMQDGDLLVVEADKTPVKEKPVDAGGMQFPNQDKTIFDTFAGNSAPPPKVERVLPKPEEPVAPAENAAEPAGWINDKLHKDAAENQPAAAAKPEQVIAPTADAAQKAQDVMVAVKKPMVAPATAVMPPKEFQVAQAVPQQADGQTTSYVSKVPESIPTPTPVPVIVAEPPKEENKPVAEEKKSEVKKEPVVETSIKIAAPAADDGAVKVQLGAYRSEKEALDTWRGMKKKHADLLDEAQPIVVKADLGAKGIYYRLRVGGFSDAAEAKAFCGKLTDAGQACIIPTAK